MSKAGSNFETPPPLSAERHYVDLLDAPKFNSTSHMCVVDALSGVAQFRYPWFADARYCWRVPVCHEYPSVKNEVLKSMRIRNTIENLARQSPLSEYELRNQAAAFFHKMRASFSKFLCKIGAYALFKIFRRISRRVLVCPAQMERLKEAEMKGIPILYLPLHRSHLDYLLITWTSWHWNLRLPHIASGDNLNLSGLGWLLRGFGAFFIRRRFHGGSEESTSDQLYRAVLNTYMIELLKNGNNIEFFLEGTRSRFGKTLLPKNGLISNIVSAVREGEIADVLLVPISVGYENTVEGVLVDELKGCEKKRESIWTVLRGFFACFSLEHRCGDVVVDYGTPVQLTNHLKVLSENIEKHNGLLNLGHETNPNSYRELVPWHCDEAIDRTLIRAVGYDIVYQAQQRKPINTSSLMAMLAVCKYRQTPVPLSKFLIALDALAHEVHGLGYTVMGWSDDATDSVDVRRRFDAGLHFLNDCLMLVPGGASSSTPLPSTTSTRSEQKSSGSVALLCEDYADEIFVQIRAYSLECLLKLAYYKNCAMAPYILISMAAITILTYRKNLTKTGFEDCVQRALTLCNLLQYEVIFCSPCDDLKYEITKAFEFLNYDELQDIDELISSHEISFYTPNDDEDSQNARFDIPFYANILRPFLQTCLAVVVDLTERPQNERINDMDYMRNFIEKYPKRTDSKHIEVMPEAINQDSMYNAVKLLRIKGIVARDGLKIVDDCKAKIYSDSFKMFLGVLMDESSPALSPRPSCPREDMAAG